MPTDATSNTKLITYGEMITLASAFAKSGFFKDSTDQAKAIVKIAYGRELGIPPVAAMCGIYLTGEGKLELDSGLTASLVKNSPRYTYKVILSTDKECEIEFLEHTPGGDVSLGISKWGEDDARRAGLLSKRNYQSYPSDMYFSRALTRGARRFCPDIFGGAVYTLGEIYDDPTKQEEPRSVQHNVEAAPGETKTVDSTATNPTPQQNAQSNRRHPPLSPVQRNKLPELWRILYGGTNEEIEIGLNNLFTERYNHDMSAATYEEGARIIGQMLAELRNKTNSPAAEHLPPPVSTTANSDARAQVQTPAPTANPAGAGPSRSDSDPVFANAETPVPLRSLRTWTDEYAASYAQRPPSPTELKEIQDAALAKLIAVLGSKDVDLQRAFLWDVFQIPDGEQSSITPERQSALTKWLAMDATKTYVKEWLDAEMQTAGTPA